MAKVGLGTGFLSACHVANSGPGYSRQFFLFFFLLNCSPGPGSASGEGAPCSVGPGYWLAGDEL